MFECEFECPYPDEPFVEAFAENAGLNEGLEVIDGGRAGREGCDAPDVDDAELKLLRPGGGGKDIMNNYS